MLAAGTSLPGQQRRSNTLGRHQRGHLVVNNTAHHGRRRAAFSLSIGGASQTLDDIVVDLLLSIGANLTHPINRAIHQIGINGCQVSIAETQLLDFTGTIVLQDHIGALHQDTNQRCALRVFEIHRQRAFIAVDHGEDRAQAIAAGTQVSNTVPPARGLHLNDISALVGEDHGGHGPRYHP